VLGSSCSIPRPNRACSSYLIEEGGRSTVLDLGTGAFGNLREYVPYESVDAIVISHMHADHFIDLVPMRYALKYGVPPRNGRVELWLPPGGETMLRALVSAFAPEGEGDFITEVYDVRTYDPTAVLRLGDASLRFAPTRHYVPTFAIRYESGGAALTYSADTAPEESVVRLARNSDLFLCEASLLRNEVEPGMRGHSSAIEAAQMAHDAAVGSLMLTHYSDGQTAEEMLDAARMVYSGPISCADDHARYDLTAIPQGVFDR
jgi:ribonuclease BN (tRNA processing enzyme)